MQEDIDRYDNPPEPDLLPTELRFELCLFCANKSNCKQWDYPPFDGMETNWNDTRVIKCNTFIVFCCKAIKTFLQFALVFIGIIIISDPDTISGWLAKIVAAGLAVLLAKFYKTLCKQEKQQDFTVGCKK